MFVAYCKKASSFENKNIQVSRQWMDDCILLDIYNMGC